MVLRTLYSFNDMKDVIDHIEDYDLSTKMYIRTNINTWLSKRNNKIPIQLLNKFYLNNMIDPEFVTAMVKENPTFWNNQIARNYEVEKIKTRFASVIANIEDAKLRDKMHRLESEILDLIKEVSKCQAMSKKDLINILNSINYEYCTEITFTLSRKDIYEHDEIRYLMIHCFKYIYFNLFRDKIKAYEIITNLSSDCEAADDKIRYFDNHYISLLFEILSNVINQDEPVLERKNNKAILIASLLKSIIMALSNKSKEIEFNDFEALFELTEISDGIEKNDIHVAYTECKNKDTGFLDGVVYAPEIKIGNIEEFKSYGKKREERQIEQNYSKNTISTVTSSNIIVFGDNVFDTFYNDINPFIANVMYSMTEGFISKYFKHGNELTFSFIIPETFMGLLKEDMQVDKCVMMTNECRKVIIHYNDEIYLLFTISHDGVPYENTVFGIATEEDIKTNKRKMIKITKPDDVNYQLVVVDKDGELS